MAESLSQYVTQPLKKNIKELLDEAAETGEIENYKERIRNLIEEINNQSEIQKMTRSNKTRWRIVTGKETYYHVERPQDEKKEKDFIEAVFNAYKEISKILTELKILTAEVKLSLVFIEQSEGGKYEYSRLDGDIGVENLYLDRTAEEKGATLSLRIREEGLKIKQKDNEYNKRISQHFQNFIKPFVDWERNGGTDWKINKGILAQTFERHWQSFPHDSATEWNDIESQGMRWLLYRMSSGSDPFFTGPDTIYSQVKTTKASVVSNIDTIINSLYGILNLLENYKTIKEKDLQKIFTQTQLSNQINENIWAGAGETGQAEIKRILKQAGFKNIKIMQKKQGKKYSTIQDKISL